MRRSIIFKNVSEGCHSRLPGISPKKDSGQAGVTNIITNSSLFRAILVIVFATVAIHCSLSSVIFASDKWQGVDESVIERIAKEHGREAREPLINTDQGDLLLFLFLAAGALGGFAAGYSWRRLMENRNARETKRKEKADGAA